MHLEEDVNSLLADLMAHMRWADALVAEALMKSPPENTEATRLFAHVASVEHLWYSRIEGRAPDYAVWPALSVEDSRTLAARHADLFQALVDNPGAVALERVVAYRNSAGRDFTSAVSQIITHVAMHGSHHRGQIAQSIRASGQEPPYVDYIQFNRRYQPDQPNRSG